MTLPTKGTRVRHTFESAMGYHQHSQEKHDESCRLRTEAFEDPANAPAPLPAVWPKWERQTAWSPASIVPLP
jgi:hypothetical protein